jgi:hypothetical protein
MQLEMYQHLLFLVFFYDCNLNLTAEGKMAASSPITSHQTLMLQHFLHL